MAIEDKDKTYTPGEATCFLQGFDKGYEKGVSAGVRRITWMFWWSLVNGIVFYSLLWYIWHHIKVVVQ